MGRHVSKFVTAALMVLVLLLLVVPAGAQDAPPEEVAPAGPVASETAIDLITLIAGIGVGLIAGGGSVLFTVDRLRNDPAAIKAVEALAQSFPPETLKLFNHLAGFLFEVTDGQPYEDKTDPEAATLPAVKATATWTTAGDFALKHPITGNPTDPKF